MTTYVIYMRDSNGILTRTHQPTIPPLPDKERLAKYPHAERLRGWPEAVVYWAKATGYSQGVAK